MQYIYVLYFTERDWLPPILLQVDEKTLLECDIAYDCPANLPNCNHMLNPTPSGKAGYCVPDRCQHGQRKS